jgi:serine/threonine protein kinase
VRRGTAKFQFFAYSVSRALNVTLVVIVLTQLAEGDRLGKYEVLRHISTGSLAELYLARIVGIDDLEKLVVIKRLLPQYVSNSGLVEIFLNEARLSATLRHQNIAQVHDIGIANGNFFFAMEYIDGEDLERITIESQVQGVPISLDAALTLVTGLCAALHHAHEKAGPDGAPLRIVHRDISPSNVLVSHAGGVKLLDFGVARAMSLQQRITRGGIKGKIAYVSPEQCRSRVGIDQRSDIFSVGVMLYQLTTGELPFTGETEYEVLHKIVSEAPPAPRAIVADYPRALNRIVMHALAPDVEHRYSTALELQTDLEDFAHTARVRISTLVLTRLMSTLFPSGTKESPPAEERESRPLVARCATQGRARRSSTIQPPRAATRARTESVITSAPVPRARTESVVPPAPPARNRVVTIPPRRADCAPAMGVPIMELPATPSTTSTAVPIAIPSTNVNVHAETTRQLITVHGVLAPTEPRSLRLPPLAVRPFATPVPGTLGAPSPPLQNTAPDLPDGPTELPDAARARRPGRWLLQGLVFASITLAVDLTVETESSEPAPPSTVSRSIPAPTPSAQDEPPAMFDEVAAVATQTARADAGDSDTARDSETDGMAISLRLDEPPATDNGLPDRPHSRRARAVPSHKSSRPAAPPADAAPVVPEAPGFDAWKYLPARAR